MIGLLDIDISGSDLFYIHFINYLYCLLSITELFYSNNFDAKKCVFVVFSLFVFVFDINLFASDWFTRYWTLGYKLFYMYINNSNCLLSNICLQY